MNDVKDFFDNIAHKWANEECNTQQLREFLSVLPIKKGDKVLDVACGQGKISGILRDMAGEEVDAIDLSPNMIDYAKKNVPVGVNFAVADFNDCKAEYDVVVVFNAYPHFVDIAKFVSTTSRAVKKGGYLAILHNMSRAELDKHHNGISSNISRKLDDVAIEYAHFENQFNSILQKDDEKSFVMILQRK